MVNINVNNLLNAISQGNHTLNEQVSFVKIQKTPCTNCKLDIVRQESTNPNCDVCGGVGYTEIIDSLIIPASVETADEYNSYAFTEAGRLVQDEIFLTVDILELNTLNSGNIFNLSDYNGAKQFIEQYNYITWNGANYSFEKFEQGFLQGILYEIDFVLKML